MRYLHPTREQYEKTWVGQRKLNNVYRGRPWVTYSHTAFRESCNPFPSGPGSRGKKSNWNRRPDVGGGGGSLNRQSVAKIAAFARFQMGNNQWMNYPPMWEPNIAFTPDEILRVHKAAFQTLRKVDPQGRVWGLTYANLNWDGAVLAHQRLFERGLLKYMDALSLHPYCAPPLTKRTFIQRLRALRKQYGHSCLRNGIRNFAAKQFNGRYAPVGIILILLGEHVTFSHFMFTILPTGKTSRNGPSESATISIRRFNRIRKRFRRKCGCRPTLF